MSEHKDERALLPISKGDNFMLGPYHFVCMGWRNGRIIATIFDGRRLITHSLSVDLALRDDFRMISKVVQP